MRRTRNQNLRSSAVVHGKKYFFSNSDEAAAIEAVANATPDIPAGTIYDNNLYSGNGAPVNLGGTLAKGECHYTTENTGIIGALNGLTKPVTVARDVEDLGGQGHPEGRTSVLAIGANNNLGYAAGFNTNRFFTYYAGHGNYDATSDDYFTNGDVGQLLLTGVSIYFQHSLIKARTGNLLAVLKNGQQSSLDHRTYTNEFGAPTADIAGVYGHTLRQATVEDWTTCPHFSEEDRNNPPSDMSSYHLVYVDIALFNKAWENTDVFVHPY